MTLHRIRERWLSNLAHDLSNPLFAVRGYVRLALDQRNGTLSDSQSRYLTAALDNLDKLAALTLELGTFRQIDELKCGTVNLGPLISGMLPDVRAKLAGKNATVVEEISPASLETAGDAEKLAGSVRELLSTAVEFTEPGGTLRIRASEEKENAVLEAEAVAVLSDRSKDLSARLSNVCKTWRLHGGACSVDKHSSGGWRITCELPLIRPQEC